MRDACKRKNLDNVNLRYGGRVETQLNGNYRANFDARDGRTIIDFGPERCGTRRLAIACATPWENDEGTAYIEGDMHFVDFFAWNPFPGHGKRPESQASIPPRNCTKEPPSVGKNKVVPCIDLWGVAAHEFGHIMGIGHAVEEEDQNAGAQRSLLTMNWQNPGDLLARSLGLGDVYALRCLYPKPGAPTPPRCSRGGTRPAS